jgi:hypothetical protein
MVKVIKNRFNRRTPKLKQVFCRHKFIDRIIANDGCGMTYTCCQKCGFWKSIEFF